MPAWPETLPQRLLQTDYQDSEPDYVARTEMDAGRPKLRRRFTANYRPFSGSMRLTKAQKDTLKNFYLTYGASQFDFPDPEADEGTLAVIFMAPPTYTKLSGLFYKVNLQFAEMP